MNLLDLVSRSAVPLPWEEGDNIPWNDADFSARMLQEHLSQAHDAASRRVDKIERQVEWIHRHLLDRRPTRILDLGCGPGLYTERLARLGHECTGIDFSPASIAYATDTAARQNLHCTYQCQDLRQAEYGVGYGLVMLIYGEINVFRPSDAQSILTKAWQALDSGGILLLEPHTFAAVQNLGEQSASWYSAQSGLFSDWPHLLLEESFWDVVAQIATVRYYVVDASTGEVTRHAQSLQAYTEEQYHSLLTECGFHSLQFLPSLEGIADPSQSGFMAVVARKGIIE